jgi:hypothetical protein
MPVDLLMFSPASQRGVTPDPGDARTESLSSCVVLAPNGEPSYTPASATTQPCPPVWPWTRSVTAQQWSSLLPAGSKGSNLALFRRVLDAAVATETCQELQLDLGDVEFVPAGEAERRPSVPKITL